MKKFRIEGIPGPGAVIYSAIVAKSPIMKDFYHMVADDVLSQKSTGRILDIGTSPGYLPLEMAQRCGNFDIRAIDISRTMVDIAGKNARAMGLQDRVEFRYGSAEKIPYTDGYFDLIVSTGSFHHWAEPKKCLIEIYRVLKNGGQAWIYDLRKDISKGARLDTKKKYGWLLSFAFLKVVPLHSSVSARELEELLSSPELKFSSKVVAERGLILKQELKK